MALATKNIYGKGYRQILLVIIGIKNPKQNISKPIPSISLKTNVTRKSTGKTL